MNFSSELHEQQGVRLLVGEQVAPDEPFFAGQQRRMDDPDERGGCQGNGRPGEIDAASSLRDAERHARTGRMAAFAGAIAD